MAGGAQAGVLVQLAHPQISKLGAVILYVLSDHLHWELKL